MKVGGGGYCFLLKYLWPGISILAGYLGFFFVFFFFKMLSLHWERGQIHS